MRSGQTGVLAFLDDLQAAEHVGAAALGRWIAVCDDPLLRGGLRTVRARDEAHATLALERLRELGGSPSRGVGPGLDALCGTLGSGELSDRAKLGMLLARLPREPSDPFVSVPFADAAADDETRALLDTVRNDDRLSVEWLRTIEGAPPVMPRERFDARERAGIVGFMGALHAATRGAAEVTTAWAATCRSSGLRGGLRAIVGRTAAHAAVLADRLRELGGVPDATSLPERVLLAARRYYGAPEVDDESKLASLLDRPEDVPMPVRAIETFAGAVVEDVESREILRLVAAGETTTVEWLSAYHQGVWTPGRARSTPG